MRSARLCLMLLTACLHPVLLSCIALPASNRCPENSLGHSVNTAAAPHSRARQKETVIFIKIAAHRCNCKLKARRSASMTPCRIFTAFGAAVDTVAPSTTGGAVESRVRQAIASQEKAKQDLETARCLVAQSTRQTFLGLNKRYRGVGAHADLLAEPGGVHLATRGEDGRAQCFGMC
jgi:hypothetical protein